MQNFRVVPITDRYFEEERGHVQKNQGENGRRMPEMRTSSLLGDFVLDRN
jgi:hypothetical protein